MKVASEGGVMGGRVCVVEASATILDEGCSRDSSVKSDVMER